MGVTGPLGKYADIVAAIVTIGIFAVWLLIHAFPTIFGVTDSSTIDAMALIAAGVVFGRATALNGTVGPTVLDNTSRLDAIETTLLEISSKDK